MNNNKLANFIVNIMNNGKSGRQFVIVRDVTSIMPSILECLKKDGYIDNYAVYNKNNKNVIIIKLKYVLKHSYINIPMKSLTIDAFYDTHESNIFDNEVKIFSPRVTKQHKHAIVDMKIVSKGSRVIYTPYNEILRYVNNHTFGTLILTTDKGIINHVDAIKSSTGGKILLEVY